MMGVGRDAVSLAVARYRLADLRDPQGRAQRAKEFMDLFRFGGYELLTSQIGLPDDELARFLEARAERIIQRMQSLLECQLDPGCDVDALRAANNAAGRRDEAELLGPEWYSRVRSLQVAGHELQFAERLNRRLPTGSALSGPDKTRLALVLAEEGQRFDAEAQQNGLQSMGHLSGDFLNLRTAAIPDSVDEYAQRRASANDYGRRLASRAAMVLSASQLAEFKAVLDADLAILLAGLGNEETEAAIRRQATRESGSQ